jgi:hypothetical protein
MLEALITSKTRIKLLLKFFLNPHNLAHLRGLAKEFDESSNSIRLELNRMEESGMLKSVSQGNKKIFQVNIKHPLYHAIHLIMKQYTGIDQIVENILKGLGNLEKVYMGGDLARGVQSDVIDLVLIGDVNKDYLLETIEKAEKATGKKIKYLTYSATEAAVMNFDKEQFLLIYEE